MTECTYEHCENPAEFLDEMDDPVCQECMEREVNESGADPQSFERIAMVI